MPRKKKLSLKDQVANLQLLVDNLEAQLFQKDLEIEKLRKLKGTIYISPDTLIPQMGLADNVANALHLQRSLTDLAERIQRGEE